MQQVIICDIDGTVAHSKHRHDRLAGKPWPTSREGWLVWEEGMEDDPPIEAMVRLVQAFIRYGEQIVFVTSREEYMREKTTLWLKKHFPLEAPVMWMRPNDSRAPSAQVKLQLIVDHVGIENVFACIEDEHGVTKAFREAGLMVIHVVSSLEDA